MEDQDNVPPRCNNCGRFIAFKDFDYGATKKLIEPDNHFMKYEYYETICIKCNSKPKEVS